MQIEYAELHSFPDGDRPHTGNPAGVALLTEALSDADLLGIARSNNLSETAYLSAKAEADLWGLRWFTPGAEVDLCGHATLAAAAWLFETGRVAGDTARFDTRSGRLEVRREGEGRYAMDFPEVGWRAGEPAPEIEEAFNIAPIEAFELDRVHGPRYRMLVFQAERDIAALEPEIGLLAAAGINILATAKGESADVVSRFFAPASGVIEDPVTGSAHCTLAPFWAQRFDRTELAARQIGPRPGALTVRAPGGGRVALIGAAKRYLDGVIRL